MSQEQQQNNSTDVYLILGIVAFIGLYFFVNHNYSYLVFLWKWIKIFELSFFYFIPDWIPLYGRLEISNLWHYLVSMDYDLIHKETVFKINDVLSGWITWPLGLFVVSKGVKRALGHQKIDTVYNEDTLLEEQSKIYPELKIIASERVENKQTRYDRDNKKETYQFGCSLDPEEFGLLNPPNLLERQAKKNSNFRSAIWDGDTGFDMDLAERAFKAQLGGRYQGFDSLNKVERKSYDILTSKMQINISDHAIMVKKYFYSILNVQNAPKIKTSKLNKPEKEVYQLCLDILNEEKARLGKKEKLNKKLFLEKSNLIKVLRDKRFNKPLIHLEAQQILSQHAFIRCGLMSLYEKARSVGVIDTGPFRWVKKEDRTLWFCLSSVGRKVSFTESSGPFAHRLVEISIGEPLHSEEVMEAVNGLKKALMINERIELKNGRK